MTNTEQHTKKSGLGKIVVLGLAGAAYYVLVRPSLLTWQTHDDEATRAMPGDEIIMHPHAVVTQAINIDASADIVWQWLTQMGRDGAGFYNFDMLTNQGRPSATLLRRDLPALQVGEPLDNGLQALQIQPQDYVVYGGFRLQNELGGTYDTTITYTLENRIQRITRVIVRMRLYSYGLRGIAYTLLREPVFFAQTTTQLNTLRRHAEATKTYQIKSRSNGHIKLTQG